MAIAPPCSPPREVTRPRTPPPSNACDTHAHVFGTADRFPYAEYRSYTPPHASLEKYLAMLDTNGVARGVPVQGSAHGRDNTPMLDPVPRRPYRLRGVAVAESDTLHKTLRDWNRLGVRALRFNHFFRNGHSRYRGGMPLTVAKTLAPGLPVAIDHIGRTDARVGRTRPVSSGRSARWARVGAGKGCRADIASASRRRTIPMPGSFTKRLVNANPEQLIWGSNWPHPRVEGEMPNAEHLFELFADLDAPDRITRQWILVSNPAIHGLYRL